MRAVTLESTDFLSSNSFAKVARYHALVLERQGVTVATRSRRPVSSSVLPAWLVQYFQDLERRPARGVRVRYDTPGNMAQAPGGVWMTPFETATLRPSWVEAAGRMERLFAHCSTSRKLLLEAGVPEEKVAVAHHGYDPMFYRPDAPAMGRGERFRFLYVGHYNARKCVDLLVQTFCEAFGGDDAVELLLHVQPMHGEDVHARVEAVRASVGGDAAIEVRESPFNGGMPEHLMAGVYRSADCLVYPSMGEGVGLPALEAKACGLEVITTRCSGMLDFLDDASAHFVEVGQVRPEPACNAIDPEYAGLKFWVPEADSLRRQLRAVYEGARRRKMPEGWTWDQRLAGLGDQLEAMGERGRLREVG